MYSVFDYEVNYTLVVSSVMQLVLSSRDIIYLYSSLRVNTRTYLLKHMITAILYTCALEYRAVYVLCALIQNKD